MGLDADVLIFAASASHPLGESVRAALEGAETFHGSTLLVPEVLIKPVRTSADDELRALLGLLGRVQLVSVDEPIADLAVDVCARYRLGSIDAIHLATAISVGADRFLTNNRKDFRAERITEIQVVHPTPA